MRNIGVISLISVERSKKLKKKMTLSLKYVDKEHSINELERKLQTLR